jgi:hypothetical protein
MMKTSFGGSPLEKGYLLLAPSTVSFLVTMSLFSLGRVFAFEEGLFFLVGNSGEDPYCGQS